MKKFLKLNKYNLFMGLLGGVAYPILVYLLQKVEPSGYIGWLISIILVVLSYIVSVIPSAFISLMQILTRYQPELVNDEKEVFYAIITTVIVIPLFNFIFFYLLASWFEWRKNNKKKANEKIS